MSPKKTAITPTEIYDQALKYARDDQVHPDVPRPCYTREWLEENIATLKRYHEWLSGGGTSALVIRTYHIPMAGHVLSLNHKPSAQLDLEQDFQIAMDYILAKAHGPSWTKNCRLSLAKFRRFLLHERGRVESKIKPYDAVLHTEGLPAGLWLTCHQLRHTFGRHLTEARVPVTSIQRLLGHARIATTQVYLYLSDKSVQADYDAAMQSVCRKLAGLGEEGQP